MQQKWQIALGFGMLVGVVAGLYFAVRAIAGFLGSLDQPIIVAILAASVTIITSTITVVAGRLLERKKEIEAHFRQRKLEQYEEMLSIIYGMMEDGEAAPNENYIKRLREWQKKLILFADPKTVRAFVRWISFLKVGVPTIRTVLLMEEFFQSLRADLGISNRGIQQGDFAQLLLKHGELFVAAAKANPTMTLAEFAELEKTVGQDIAQQIGVGAPEQAP